MQQGPTAPSTAVNAGEVFAPYKSKQYEAGIKIDAGTFATTLSAFQIKKPSGLTDPDTLIYSLNGEQRHRGLELNLFGEPVKGTRLMGGVMLLDAEMVRASNSTYNGNDPVGVPRWTATLGAEWDVPFQPGLTMTARAVYNGSQYLNSANTLKVSPWTRFDVGARYTFKQSGIPVTIRATVNNGDFDIFTRHYALNESPTSKGSTIPSGKVLPFSFTFLIITFQVFAKGFSHRSILFQLQ